MKLVFVKILCWVAGIGAVGYVGLTVANSIPSINRLTASIPVIKSIPTPIIEPLAESTMIDNCKSSRGENAEVVRISDAPESEGSYTRWECVVKNHNKTEEEYQEYLTELGKYKEWPRDPNYKLNDYTKAECKYYDGLYFEWAFGQGSTVRNATCVQSTSEHYQEDLEQFERAKSEYIIYETIDYSKE